MVSQYVGGLMRASSTLRSDSAEETIHSRWSSLHSVSVVSGSRKAFNSIDHKQQVTTASLGAVDPLTPRTWG